MLFTHGQHKYRFLPGWLNKKGFFPWMFSSHSNPQLLRLSKHKPSKISASYLVRINLDNFAFFKCQGYQSEWYLAPSRYYQCRPRRLGSSERNFEQNRIAQRILAPWLPRQGIQRGIATLDSVALCDIALERQQNNTKKQWSFNHVSTGLPTTSSVKVGFLFAGSWQSW